MEKKLLLLGYLLSHSMHGYQLNQVLQHSAGLPITLTKSNAYKLLGADSNDSMAAIKKKYRTLVKRHHPDIIKAQGASDDYIDQATDKVQEINAAYEMVKKAKGA